ncbi:DUF1697 domain-containing protein [Marixanthomonas spongiae]|uniref:DUF1697 domain-containing protein n=1 Tax=Marixanthomonas spongiae TaxID=2174845 RepID=A0A2U0I8C0_9FLAO|nr:DUF1697 domain-containing protein [Marixanthomonas spongiae]PVW17347.1 DUF1697 domain-containing protein [Marixanthomonas spongiae]
MQAHIAFLRGINVAGKKKFPKAEQVATLNKLGFKKPKVYLHTGNWIFDTSEKDVASKISEAITKKYGWDVPVLVKTASEIETIVQNCPFSEEKKIKSYFTLLHQPPQQELIKAIDPKAYPNEEFHITPYCVYFYSETGYGRTKCNNNFFETKLKVSATTRNYKTMMKVLELTT